MGSNMSCLVCLLDTAEALERSRSDSMTLLDCNSRYDKPTLTSTPPAGRQTHLRAFSARHC